MTTSPPLMSHFAPLSEAQSGSNRDMIEDEVGHA